MIDDTIKIVSHDIYLGLSIVEQVALDFAMMKQKMFTWVSLFASMVRGCSGFPTDLHSYLVPHLFILLYFALHLISHCNFPVVSLAV